MGKQVKVNLENKEEIKEETTMEENKEVKTENTAVANEEAHENLPATTEKENRNWVAKTWNEGGIIGKGAIVLTGTAMAVAIGFGIKVLVGYFFGPEAAEAIDPTALVPTEE